MNHASILAGTGYVICPSNYVVVPEEDLRGSLFTEIRCEIHVRYRLREAKATGEIGTTVIN